MFILMIDRKMILTVRKRSAAVRIYALAISVHIFYISIRIPWRRAPRRGRVHQAHRCYLAICAATTINKFNTCLPSSSIKVWLGTSSPFWNRKSSSATINYKTRAVRFRGVKRQTAGFRCRIVNSCQGDHRSRDIDHLRMMVCCVIC